MHSITEATANNKQTALEQLRLSRQQTVNRPLPTTLPSSGTAPPQVLYTPPAQSRDATITSRFFPSTPASIGKVLVPSSSPFAFETGQLSNQPHTLSFPYDVAPQHSANLVAGRPQPLRMSADPLSAPSGFVSSGNYNNPSLRRPWNSENHHVNGAWEEGPPRKKQYLGSSSDLATSPSSPVIQLPGQRRRAISGELYSTSSDDCLPEVGTSRPRIVRGRPASIENSPPNDPTSDEKFKRFKMTMPMQRPDRVQAAWIEAKGDVRRATELLDDLSWAPTPAVPKAQPLATGRVEEIDEANKAQRVAVKEKGKKSMIYANRPVLEVKPPSVATPTVKRVAEVNTKPPPSPDTPVVIPARRKRIKKMVVDSDSDVDFAESSEDEGVRVDESENRAMERALDYYNKSASETLQELTGCTPDQANAIIGLRPFESVDDLNEKLAQGKKKAGPAGISSKMFDESTRIFREYAEVDSILEDCERIGSSIRAAIAQWTTGAAQEKGKAKESPTPGDAEDGALSMTSLVIDQKPKDYLTTQPSLVSEAVQLKEYQLLGVNWLNLLYRSDLSCILADEMGLGKTAQVISFLAYLKERGTKGPHLIIVPSSTLENWCREFARFAPSLSVQTYYGGKEERVSLRQTLLDSQRCKSRTDDGWEVLITTYNLAQGDERDRKFFRKIDWNCCVYDEGHVLKNFQSQRYQAMLKMGSKWRLLLTGTPLQNNLQELVSLMNFILPDTFSESLSSLRTIFKVKGDSKVSLLSQERVSRAKKMMTPFVLRRRKDQVLKDLPNKTERIEWCDMTDLQKTIYRDTLKRSRKTVLAVSEETDGTSLNGRSKPPKKKAKPNGKSRDTVYAENSANVLMDLRKAASHPMLFRKRFTDSTLSSITKQLLKEPDFKKRGALYELVKEDMSVMTDAELQIFCATYKSTRQYLQDPKCYHDAGKIQILMKLLAGYEKEQRKVLIFSQFTQILDILQAILKHASIPFLLLTGSTPVDVRQTLVDEFTEDKSIPVFLLSTKAGGMGINLTAASVVIMFDQDFNPHNDRQAQDRAYRIGQKRDVDVVKLISRGTIEEDMLKLGETKLALDEAVAGDTEDVGDSAQDREMKTSLMNVLRQQFEKQGEEDQDT